MLGQLPTTLDVNGTQWAVRPSYLNVFRIFSVFEADELTDQEKSLVFLRRMYVDFPSISPADYAAAYEAAMRFIEAGEHKAKPSPRVIYWEKDEQMLFAAVNAAAGCEVRNQPDMHWWTFLGHFQNIDAEGTYGTILRIRTKRKKHKKLEKYEKEFYQANTELISEHTPTEKKKSAYDYMDALYEELRKEGGG